MLIGFMFPIISNNRKSTYLEVWKNIITNDEILDECRKVLDIIEICFLLPRISEEGPSIFDFNPATSIDAWYAGAVRRLNSGQHNYPEKRKRCDGSRSSK